MNIRTGFSTFFQCCCEAQLFHAVGLSFSVGIQLFVTSNASDHEEARAFYREDVNPSKVDIFSNSWGPTDNGRTIRGPGKLAREAFKLGAEKARTIFTFKLHT